MELGELTKENKIDLSANYKMELKSKTSKLKGVKVNNAVKLENNRDDSLRVATNTLRYVDRVNIGNASLVAYALNKVENI